jgi:hypothetical protein
VQQIEIIKLNPLEEIYCLFLQGQNEGKVVIHGVERTITDSHEY